MRVQDKGWRGKDAFGSEMTRFFGSLCPRGGDRSG
jgi:hypothetical protein